MGLVVLPAIYAAPALYKFCFSNSTRGSFSFWCDGVITFIASFLPVTNFENLFSELTLYLSALFVTFFIYNMFPELILEDGIWMFYCAALLMSMFPLAFAYLPTFMPRAYLTL